MVVCHNEILYLRYKNASSSREIFWNARNKVGKNNLLQSRHTFENDQDIIQANPRGKNNQLIVRSKIDKNRWSKGSFIFGVFRREASLCSAIFSKIRGDY